MGRDHRAVSGLYDRWARHPWAYDAMTRLALFGRREELRACAVCSLGLRPGGTVLDLACGAGADLAALSEAVGPAGLIRAIDVSPGMLEGAAERGRELGVRGLDLIEADLASVELAPAEAGGALIALALSALPDRIGTLRRVHAALRPGARLAVLDTLPFAGRLAPLNSALGPPFRAATNWDYRADLIGELGTVFGSVRGVRANGGSALVATAERG